MAVKFTRDFRGRVTNEMFFPAGFVGEFKEDIEDRLVNYEQCAEFVKEKKAKVVKVEEDTPEEVK
jgi:hypothetical protein